VLLNVLLNFFCLIKSRNKLNSFSLISGKIFNTKEAIMTHHYEVGKSLPYIQLNSMMSKSSNCGGYFSGTLEKNVDAYLDLVFFRCNSVMINLENFDMSLKCILQFTAKAKLVYDQFNFYLWFYLHIYMRFIFSANHLHLLDDFVACIDMHCRWSLVVDVGGIHHQK